MLISWHVNLESIHDNLFRLINIGGGPVSPASYNWKINFLNDNCKFFLQFAVNDKDNYFTPRNRFINGFKSSKRNFVATYFL